MQGPLAAVVVNQLVRAVNLEHDGWKSTQAGMIWISHRLAFLYVTLMAKPSLKLCVRLSGIISKG